MQVSQIEFYQFRNLENQLLAPGRGTTLIYGDNGQGKTNIIEAIWLFSCGKSFRAAADREMIRFGCDTARLKMRASDPVRDVGFEAVLHRERRKELFVSGEKLKKNADLLGGLCTVLFVPDHLRLVSGSPGERRRFLDISLCQQSKGYMVALGEYNKLLERKNALLKQGYRLSDDELDVWDESLALRAAKITAASAAYIERLQEFCLAVQEELSGGEEELVLYYESQVDPHMAEADIAAAYLERLRYERGTDLLNGVTGAGAHRDDLGIELNSAPLKKYGSQGQKRSAVLALKLAEGMVLEQAFGYSPVFLLDDVLSELDEGRREYILSKIEGRQVIITGCTREAAPAGTVRYYVKDGRAVED